MPRVTTSAGAHTAAANGKDHAVRFAARAKRAWGRFKLAAISSFAFVESAGPIYVAKLLRDGLRLAANVTPETCIGVVPVARLIVAFTWRWV